jgi:hypothetical protein
VPCLRIYFDFDKEFLKNYHQHTFLHTHLALQMGLLSKADWAGNPGKRISKNIQKSAKAQTKEKSGRSAVRFGNQEMNVIRKQCNNTLHLAVCVLHEFATYFLLHLIVAVMAPLVEYYHNQNVKLRDVNSAQAWYQHQMESGFACHLCEIVQVLHKRSALESMGLVSGSGGVHDVHPVQHPVKFFHSHAKTFQICSIHCSADESSAFHDALPMQHPLQFSIP